MHPLLSVSLRYKALYVPQTAQMEESAVQLQDITSVLLANLHRLGFVVDEPLCRALNAASPIYQADVLDSLRTVLGVQKNWTPLVKGWQIPTGENRLDHVITWFVNLVGGPGADLPCGHTIPTDTFPLERYNGCPYCGTPFEHGAIEHHDQGTSKQLLTLWTQAETEQCLANLIASKTALDATQRESLATLLAHLPLPEKKPTMKETAVLVISCLVDQGKPEAAQALLDSPTDILRYLWHKKTGLFQIAEPSILIRRTSRNSSNIARHLDHAKAASEASKAALKLKYSRAECKQVATWLNALQTTSQAACENMHPKRRIWVRFIRALRLVEYATKPGYPALAAILQAFHAQDYTVHAGILSQNRLKRNAAETFQLLQKRPGLFARSLFANMLWFGPEPAIQAFSEVVDKVPARLLFTLQTISQLYFSASTRTVKPLGGPQRNIPANKQLDNYDVAQREHMQHMITDLCLLAMRKRFAALPTTSKTIFIDPCLFKMPVAIGERSDTVQDLPVALMGTRFPVEGDSVRLFMQWGMGLPAQHMDMDLSCRVSYDYSAELCSFSRLTITGCKHSGDIRHIPEKIGTAEYIEINLPELIAAQATYVVFTCNAYSNGEIVPEMVIGWMNSAHPMAISETTGVAYDPSCVQHQVRITRSLSKGLVFGVLDVASREIIWLEMSFSGQLAGNLNTKAVNALLAKLNSRLSIGSLLALKAESQGLTILPEPTADENYTRTWAVDAAAVTMLLVN